MMGEMEAEQTRVMVGGDIAVPDHASVRVLETSSTGAEVIARAATEFPDVVVLDIDIDDPGARAVCRRLREWAPKTRVLVVGAADDERLYSSLVAGATGGLLARAADEEWVTAIQLAQKGASVLPPRAASRILHDIDAWATRSADPLYPPPTLTSTERDVLGRLASGVGTDEIAAAYDVTPNLVSLHAGFAVGKLHRYVLGAETITAHDA